MLIKTFRIMLALSVFVLLQSPTPVLAAEDGQPLPLPPAERQLVVDSIIADYYAWENISMSGKLSSPMLPVTASVKIYMEKGNIILVSVSAPIIGEAARIEIDGQEALVVNKLKNSYTVVAMEDLETFCPGGLNALQDLILGRIDILGKGELGHDDAGLLDLYDTGEGSWMLLPAQDLDNAPYVYFYTVNCESYLPERLAVIAQNGEGEMDCYYVWDRKNVILNFLASLGGKGMEATLRLNNPDTTVKPLSRLELSSKYRQTDLKGVLK